MSVAGAQAGGAAPRGARRWRRRGLVALVVVAAVIALAWLLRAEPVTPPAWLQQPQPLNIAHGGAQARAPANTLPAFEQAVDLGADVLELDVQLSADDRVVVIHDDTVDRTTDGTGRVRQLTLAELQRLDAGYAWTDEDGDTPYRGEGVRIPTLAQVLEAFPDHPIIMELKTGAGVALASQVAETLRLHDREDDVLVASFDEALVDHVRAVAPGVATSMAEDEVRTFYTLHLAGLHRWWRPPGVAFQVSEHYEGRHVVDQGFVDAAGDLGVQVHVWTVNERARMRRMIDLGVQGIITDHPGRLADVLGDEGA